MPALPFSVAASMVRAFIMCAIYLFAEFIYRDNDAPTSLALAVFLMALANPFIIFNVGFILSVLSVMGILLFSRKFAKGLTKFAPDKMADVLSLSLSAQITVFPVVVYYFGTVPPYSLLSNALLVPVSGIYVILGMLFIMFSPVPALPEGIAYVMKLLSGCISSVSGWIKTLPSSLIDIDGNIYLFFVIWVVLLVLLAVHPFKRNRVVALSVAFVLSCAVVFAPKDIPQVYPLRYGSKTMTVVHSPKGDSFLIDCPSLYDALIIEKESNPFTTVVLSGNDGGKIFYTDSNIERIIASDIVFCWEERAKVTARAKEENVQLILLDDYEKFQIGDAVMEYIPVEGFDDIRIVKVYYNNETYLSFQGISGTDIREFGERNLYFESDYVILPYTAFARDKEIFSGKILK